MIMTKAQKTKKEREINNLKIGVYDLLATRSGHQRAVQELTQKIVEIEARMAELRKEIDEG